MRNAEKRKQLKRYRRQVRSRARIFGTRERPRLCVSRSLKHIYAQLIDDQKGQTLVAVNDLQIKKKLKESKGTKAEIAKKIGQMIAKEALKKKINKVVFDRSGRQYHGRVKAVAEGARQEGLKF